MAVLSGPASARWRRLPGLATLAMLLLAASVALSGCGGVQQRPSFEQATSQYDAMLDELRTEISQVLGGTDWSELAPASTSPGDTTYGAGALIAQSALWALPRVDIGSVSALTRSELIRGLSAIVQRYGFSDFTPYSDSSESFRALAADSYHTEVQFSAGVDLTLSYRTQALPAEGAGQ